ncbi:MAG: hypothetical protein QGH45_10645 [Myxococcota bacterium]|jgi:hypothetical protein|nr:hypothetical protein [Myxococcota bacterium]
MELPRERIGPYTRALQAGVDALAPNDDHVPLPRTLAHLQALDPALSGDLLLPGEVDDRSGLPAFVWMERALAEQAVSRGALGPFWFPGFPLPDGVPATLGRGLVLHSTAEVVGDDVHTSAHRDPLIAPDPEERPPDGTWLYRERRLAVSAGLIDAARSWAADRGCVVPVVGLHPRRPSARSMNK